MKKIHTRMTLYGIQYAIVLGLGIVIASCLVVVWLYNAHGTEVFHQKSPNNSSVAQAIDGNNLIGDWVITNAVVAPKNVLVVTVSSSKELGVTTNVHGELVIFLRGQKVLDFPIENEVLGAHIGSKSLVLRSTVSSSMQDVSLQELRVEWTPREVTVHGSVQ